MLKTQIYSQVKTAPLVKIGPKHQITIPKPIFDAFDFNIGDFLQMVIQGNKLLVLPKQITEKRLIPKLSFKEQKSLLGARKKIKAINDNIIKSKGLTTTEANVATKAGLINEDQKWWWTEKWQKGEREAEKDLMGGNVSPTFNTAKEAINYLKTAEV